MPDDPKTEDSFDDGFSELPELRKKVIINRLDNRKGVSAKALEAYLQKLEDVIRRIL